ncbi:hypothetical protein Cri9333_1874 [Crinalium epipsammum PCC 9333]|uniref:DUF3131 domain-containing protein n=1 Tax=Crinalium epipsammum PCC 9333 TaxID=1173022 RepID=K9VZ32_9CYAN|nr:DUF3131 domain-containing protein [Crinalium epipsammum]AFZ12757.1 hypothetical protein Cri9333_1874 [Crinalium epipsammum PCC 9333]
MNQERNGTQWSKLMALSLTGATIGQLLPYGSVPVDQALAQNPSPNQAACTDIVTPLTQEEQEYARTAWQYFVKNYQPTTGLVNSTGGYPSGTLWDMANYLVALNTVRGLDIVTQADFEARLNKFLTGISALPLFNNALPNKVYNAATGAMVDYGNNPQPNGIGWSALDIGRMLAAFHIIRTCHPEYADWVTSVVSRWKLEQSIKDGQLYGAVVLPDGKTQLVQEGRLGYEEYAARGYELWGFKPNKAIAIKPFQFVKVNNIKIPADSRDYQSTNSNNYVVSESYILDGIEFGLQGYLKDYSRSVFEAQKRHYEETGELTTVLEDDINQAPYFLSNNVYSNGVPWAVITDENKPNQQLHSLSTKAAFGWRYLYPDDSYAQKIFDVAKDLRNADGFYAGLDQETQKPNSILTGNTNGLILEILYYKARGNRPLINPTFLSLAEAPPTGNQSVITNALQNVAVAEIPAVSVEPAPIPKLARLLNPQEKRYAEAAWKYFQANYEPNTGLISDRSDVKGVTPWGIGDYIAALHAARSLDVISSEEFDNRTSLLLGALQKLPLYGNEIPSRSYDPRTLQPVDYGGNTVSQGTGWSALDIGRLMSALYNLKSAFPQYTNVVDQVALQWSYLKVVRDQRLQSAIAKHEGNQSQADANSDYMLSVVYPEVRLGYEEYAARGFQLWGFDVDRSSVGGKYQSAPVEGINVPTKRIRPDVNAETNQYTVSDPFLLYGLEFGIDPQMRQLLEPIRRAQAERYRRTGKLTAGGTTVLDREPYVVRSTIIADQEPWATLADDGTRVPDVRTVSTASAFALKALYPEDSYTTELWRASTDLYDSSQGYYEGFLENTGQPVKAFTSTTNSMVLQSLLYQVTNQQPIVTRNTNINSPWWQAVAKGNSSRGLPVANSPTTQLVTDSSGTYWASVNNRQPVALQGQPTLNNPPVASQQPPRVDNSAIASSLPATTEFTAPVASTPPVVATAPQTTPNSTTEGFTAPVASTPPVVAAAPSPPPRSTLNQPPRDSASADLSVRIAAVLPRLQADTNLVAAQIAWQYFERNWNSETGLVNSLDNNFVTNIWDQASAILAIHSARQLSIINSDLFNSRFSRLLQTLETLPLSAAKLRNQGYNTRTAKMIRLEPNTGMQSPSGSSSVDLARFLLALHVIKTNYPEYSQRVNNLVSRSNLLQVVKNGLQQPGTEAQGYQQYAAKILNLWNVDVAGFDNFSLASAQNSFSGSNSKSDRTIDPYILWGLELGWPEAVKTQLVSLLQSQAQKSYFKNYSLSTNDQPWQTKNKQTSTNASVNFLSTKSAFAWESLLQDDPYATTLRNYVQNLAQKNRGYLSGRYENSQNNLKASIDVNTNAMILESLLYQARNRRPLAF